MTNNIITREEAFARLSNDEPCESFASGEWRPTRYNDFCDKGLQFRKPPEPRRVAQVFDDVVRISFGRSGKDNVLFDSPATLREVLPGDVTLQRMTEAQCQAEFTAKVREVRVNWTREEHAYFDGWLASRRALGLIGEGS